MPQAARIQIRRWFALRKLPRVADAWPIKHGSERVPEGWAGWPEGRQFAFLLSHDVEGQRGLDNVVKLAELEMEFGFRSQFNFIPEGPYTVSPELRAWLTDRGFEVGVHDLHHDGLLYSSRREFRRHAGKINNYLKEWGAVGFRSGFMLHRLDWLHDLEVCYDASTFDTDPFEPQPDGSDTIFPFWVARPPGSPGTKPGYVELPYTLPQDSTLFLLLREPSIAIWKKKLDWLVEKGGMALVNIHPDYIDFTDHGSGRTEYPVRRIRELLQYVTDRFGGSFWSPLPKEAARWFRSSFVPAPASAPLSDTAISSRGVPAYPSLAGRRAAVLLYSDYPADPRPRRAAEALADSGVEVDLLCLRENDHEPDCETINGVRVHRVAMRRQRGSRWNYFAQYGIFLAASFFFLARRAFSRRYDIVHIHNMPDVLVFAAAIPKLLGARLILDLHDPMPELMVSIYEIPPSHWIVCILRALERWSIAFVDLAITPNLSFKQLFESRSSPPGKMDIVMNSPESLIFDPDRFTSAETNDTCANGEFRIMHHGSIVHRHGVDLLIEAVARLRSRIPGVRLDIYGSRTSFLNEVLALAGSLGVADAVHFQGPKNQSEIARAICECHVGVVPNRRSPFTELNFPTRLFEYLAMHRPVLAPATQGIQDYFGPEDLVFFEPGNIEHLADRLFWVYAHPEAAAQLVQRGREIYHHHLWSGEKARLLRRIAALTAPAEALDSVHSEAVRSAVENPADR